MTRKKVELTYITNDSKRKAAFKKRKDGLMKKINEISTLCGIEACAIIYDPNDPKPEVWPSPCGVQSVVSRFRRMPEVEQSKKMLNHESFLRQRIQKAQEQLKKQINENRKKEMTHLMFQYLGAGKIFDNANMTDLNDISWLIDQNLKDIERKINQSQAQEGTLVAENGSETVSGEKQVHMDHDQGLETNMDAMQKQNWSMNFINGGGDEMLPFGADIVQSGLWPNP
ncbi:agamous-like MADS-box protein AGL80 [Gastrolobium bilobum]|uniref:agamous-like MADS-box protein AGL80 n=1 Tax=Gastrolobium bilobum TaxID=150636 RepID=UPI002AB1B75E|nr:agamous-like MADS-box protein AGL80 [Gastrolobium bilobum]